MSDKRLTRRFFIQGVALAVPAGATLLQVAAAQEKPPILDPDDPAAKALLYVHDTNEVDKSNPLAARHTPEQKCSNCLQIQGKDGEEWRPCAIFPGKLVAADGWCSVWAKKP